MDDTNAKARAAFHNGGEYLYGLGIERAQGSRTCRSRWTTCASRTAGRVTRRVGWMRSVATSTTPSASFLADELAIKAGRDSKDYLLELIGEGRILPLEGRRTSFDNNGLPPFKWRGLLRPSPLIHRHRGCGRWWSGWRGVALGREGQELQADEGARLGIAAHRSFLSMSPSWSTSRSTTGMSDRQRDLRRIDCGMAVNPDRSIAQMEGGIIYGLSYAYSGDHGQERSRRAAQLRRLP